MYAGNKIEHEHGLEISIKGLKRLQKDNPGYKTEKMTERINKKLENIFAKKIVGVKIIMNKKSDKIDRVIFIFHRKCRSI